MCIFQIFYHNASLSQIYTFQPLTPTSHDTISHVPFSENVTIVYLLLTTLRRKFSTPLSFPFNACPRQPSLHVCEILLPPTSAVHFIWCIRPHPTPVDVVWSWSTPIRPRVEISKPRTENPRSGFVQQGICQQLHSHNPRGLLLTFD